MPRYLFFFQDTLQDFAIPEIESALCVEGLDASENVEGRDEFDAIHHPVLWVRLPSDDVAERIAHRCILVRNVLEPWAWGKSVDAAAESLRDYPRDRMEPFIQEGTSFSVVVASMTRRKLSLPEQNVLRDPFLDKVDWRGSVNLDAPDTLFRVAVELDEATLQARKPRTEEERQEAAQQLPQRAKWLVFGRQVAESRRTEILESFDLRRRAYLGPTSLNPEITLLMANQALATPRSCIFDPFVGTGSLLLAARYLGAFAIGSDIDYRVFQGKGGHTIQTNFAQMGLGKPECFRSDITRISLSGSLPRSTRTAPLFDAIMCDPPYGVRAGARTIATVPSTRAAAAAASAESTETPSSSHPRAHKRTGDMIPDHLRHSRVPRTEKYDATRMLVDMVDSAARLLRVGGRLVFLFPSTVDFVPEELPAHPCLRLVATSTQRLGLVLTRLLVTMEKVTEYDFDRVNEYRDAVLRPAREANVDHDNLMDRIHSVRERMLIEAADEVERFRKKKRRQAQRRQKRHPDGKPRRRHGRRRGPQEDREGGEDQGDEEDEEATGASKEQSATGTAAEGDNDAAVDDDDNVDDHDDEDDDQEKEESGAVDRYWVPRAALRQVRRRERAAAAVQRKSEGAGDVSSPPSKRSRPQQRPIVRADGTVSVSHMKFDVNARIVPKTLHAGPPLPAEVHTAPKETQVDTACQTLPFVSFPARSYPSGESPCQRTVLREWLEKEPWKWSDPMHPVYDAGYYAVLKGEAKEGDI